PFRWKLGFTSAGEWENCAGPLILTAFGNRPFPLALCVRRWAEGKVGTVAELGRGCSRQVEETARRRVPGKWATRVLRRAALCAGDFNRPRGAIDETLSGRLPGPITLWRSKPLPVPFHRGQRRAGRYRHC